MYRKLTKVIGSRKVTISTGLLLAIAPLVVSVVAVVLVLAAVLVVVAAVDIVASTVVGVTVLVAFGSAIVGKKTNIVLCKTYN